MSALRVLRDRSQPLPTHLNVGLALAVAVAYFLAARLSLALMAQPENVAVFWPASGIAAGLLIALGRRAVRAVAAGVLLATVMANMLGDRNVVAAIFFGLCNAGEALLTAWLVERWYGDGFQLNRVRRVLRFLLAALIGPAVAAVVAAAAIRLTGVSLSSFRTVWQAWFLSDAIGIATIAPFVIGLAGIVRSGGRPAGWPPYAIAEGCGLVVVLALLAGIAFGLPPGPLATVATEALVFPALLLVAARCVPLFTAAGVAVTAIIIVSSMTLGVGNLGDVTVPLPQRVLASQALMFAITLAGLMLSALFAERRASEAKLNASEARYRSVVEGSLQGIIIQQDNRIRYANPAMANIFGYTRPEDLIGKSVFDDFVAAEERPVLRERTAAVYRGERIKPHPGWRGFRKDGSEIWVSAMAHLAEWQGAPAIVSFYLDTTERKRTEANLRESEERLRLATQAARIGTFVANVASGRVRYSPELAKLLGVPGLVDVKIEDSFARVHLDDVGYVRERYAASLDPAGDGRMEMELRFVRPGGQVRWMSFNGEAQFQQTSKGLVPFRVVGVCVDITGRKRGEERQQTLTRELDHRVKNTLERVLVIIDRSAEGAGSTEELVQAIDGRIQALAQAHSLLSQKNWNGADLAALVAGELMPYQTASNTVIEGPSIMLTPDAAQAVIQVLHELATNALKHGAFSVPAGKVSARWWHEPVIEAASPVPPTGIQAGDTSPGRMLVIEWLESGGPPVNASAQKGYGSDVIGGLIPYELGGKVDVEMRPSGLFCRIAVPAVRVEADVG